MSNITKSQESSLFEVITNGLRVTGNIDIWPSRQLPNGKVRPRTYRVEINAKREQGPIEGYYEYGIMGLSFQFDTLDKARDHLSLVHDKIKLNGVRTEFENDKYYVQDCVYWLWIDEVTDEREREHQEWRRESNDSPFPENHE